MLRRPRSVRHGFRPSPRWKWRGSYEPYALAPRYSSRLISRQRLSREGGMDFGVLMFMTDYAMPAPDLAKALEERGFESLWAPEHSHIPLTRKTPFPGGGDLPKPYYD